MSGLKVNSRGQFGPCSLKWLSGGLLVACHTAILFAQPVITNQPLSQAVPVGSNVTFQVGASGVEPFAYQWQLNDTPILDATNSLLELFNVQFTNAGEYSVLVTNAAGPTLSSNAVLTVNGPPQITQHPQGATVLAGTNFTFSVAAIGPTPYGYKWRLFGTNLVVPNTNTLTLTDVQAANAGDYTVVLTNTYGSTTSEVAVLTVDPVLPAINLQPPGATVPEGTNFSFTVIAVGTEPFFYQWLFNGTNLVGQISPTLALTNVQSANAGDYSVIVSNSVGTNLSDVATLTVNPAGPGFSAGPSSVAATRGAEVIMSDRAYGSEMIGYQWQFGGADLPGATGATLLLTNVQSTNAGVYQLVATNAYGTNVSAPITLTITPPPGFLWARSAGSTAFARGRSVAVDGTGNAYVAGDFQGTATFGTTNLTTATDVGIDIFLAKYDSDGRLLWVRQAGGAGLSEANALAVDSTGNVLVAGQFSAGAEFSGVALTNAGSSDVYVAKYTSAGELVWVRGFGGTSVDIAYGICVDASDNIAIVGNYAAAITFGTNILSASGNFDVFTAKLDADGNVLWARKAAGSGNETGYAVVADRSGNVFVGGSFQSTTFSLGGLVLTNPAVGLDDVFVAKYDRDGNMLWAKRAGGTSHDSARALAADQAGNVFVAGYYGQGFGSAATFDNVTLTPAGASADVFLAKYDASGNLAWVKSAGGSLLDYGYALASDAGGNAYLAGSFTGTATFGSSNLTSSGGSDIFVAAYSTAGNVLWSRKAGGTGFDSGYGIAADLAGNLYLAGNYASSNATFGHLILSPADSSGIFLAKLATVDSSTPPTFTLQPSNQIAQAGANVALSSGFVGAPPVGFQWRFNGVDIVGQTNVTLTFSNILAALAGDYDLVLSNPNGSVTSAVATITVATESDFVWARRGGGASNDTALATAADASGNVYTAGYFSDTADFGGTNLVSNGREDIFVTKRDIAGNLLWAKQFGGSGNDRATAMSLAFGGGIVVAGVYEGTVQFGGTTLTNAGRTDVFLAVLQSNGSVTWAVRSGGPNMDFAEGVTVDNGSVAGPPPQIYVTGFFQTNATFGSTIFSDNQATNKFFIAAYNTSGGFVWARKSDGVGPSRGRAVASAGIGVCVAGSFASAAMFSGSSLVSAGGLDGFVLRYDSAGNLALTPRRAGTLTNTAAFNDEVTGVAVDTNGNFFVTGYFQGQATFDGSNGISSVTTGQPDFFLAKYSRAGILLWVRQGGGIGPSGGKGVVLDPLGNAYVTGSFSNSATFAGTTLTGAGGTEMFCALYDSMGELVKARRAGGVGDDAGLAAATDGKGNMFVAGSHSAPAAFGSNALANAGGADAFLTRLTLFASNALPQITTQPRSQSVVFSNSVTLSVGVLSPTNVTYRWRLNGTNISNGTSNTLTIANVQYPNLGDYTVVVSNVFGRVTSAVAVVTLELTPEFLWLRKSGGPADDQALAVAMDRTNNAVYVAGLFSGTNPALSNLVSSGGTDIFLARYDTNGSVIWGRKAGGSSGDAAQGLAVDRFGNIFVTGYFNSSKASFGGITITNRSSPVAPFADLFLAKYDSAGNVLWAKQGGGVSPNSANRNDLGTAVATDGDGNAYLTGSYHSVASIGGILLSNLNYANFFLAKYDPAGNVLWAKTVVGTNTSQGNGVAVDAETNVYVTGYLMGRSDFGSGPITNASTFLNATVFVAKYDRNGNLLWARKRAGDASGFGQALAADAFGAVYATSAKRDYGPGILLTKYDSAGNPIWSRTGNISCCTGDSNVLYGLALDPFGNPIVTGFGNGAIEGLTNNMAPAVGFVAKYRNDGSGLWIQRLGQAGNGVVVDGAGNAYLAGRFTGASFFGATSNLVSSGGSDAFLVKLGVRPPGLTTAPTNQLVIAGSNATLQVVGAIGSGPLAYQWQLNGTNIAGATKSSLALNNFGPASAGRYSVILKNTSGSFTGIAAGVGLIPVLNASLNDDGLVLSWAGTFVLQSADDVAGPYTDLPRAASPYTNIIALNDSQRFFRLRVGNPEMQGQVLSNQWFAISIAGSPGRSYTIMASTNLLDWVSLQTDVSPFTLPDTNSTGFPQRFYRALLVP
jgi:Immunoglobulin domain/Beta-propeller repeat